jgi:hypothetical protein
LWAGTTTESSTPCARVPSFLEFDICGSLMKLTLAVARTKIRLWISCRMKLGNAAFR